MLNCKDIVNNASDYLNSDVPLIRRIGILIHLAMCVNCRRYYQQITQSINSVSAIKPEEQDDTDTSQLAHDLHALQQRMKSGQD